MVPLIAPVCVVLIAVNGVMLLTTYVFKQSPRRWDGSNLLLVSAGVSIGLLGVHLSRV